MKSARHGALLVEETRAFCLLREIERESVE
jgi:hypothetical protein